MALAILFREMGKIGTPSELDVELPEWDKPVSLEELIRETVRAQVRAYQRDQRSQHEALQKVAKAYLTEEMVNQGAETGKVALPKPERAGALDEEQLESDALVAFEKGRFAVFSCGRQSMELDEELDLQEQTEVHFLRLVPLVGG